MIQTIEQAERVYKKLYPFLAIWKKEVASPPTAKWQWKLEKTFRRLTFEEFLQVYGIKEILMEEKSEWN